MTLVSKTMRFGLFAALAFATQLAPNAAHAAQDVWSITRPQWTPQDEQNYSRWISALGESGCSSVDECLKSPANPYRVTDPANYKFWADCGRFPYLLRAYFAWKNGLPFSVISQVAPVDGDLGQAHDIRYSPKGNYPIARRDVIQKTEAPLVGTQQIERILSVVFTANYRVNAEHDEMYPTFSDFVPVRIDRNGIRPGTVIYDANGHAAVVYKVTDDGRILFFDAHPDHSVTHSTYGKKFAHSSPASGGGFKNFRPLFLVGAQRSIYGTYVGGQVSSVPMTQQPNFSMEQFYGNYPSQDGDWKKGKFYIRNEYMGFYEWVRFSLATPGFKYQPLEELTNDMDSICNDIKERVPSIQAATTKGIIYKPQPLQLPDNIYGAHGEWEDFATPSRDARLKTSFVELREQMQHFVELYQQRSARINFSNPNLIRDLRNTYEQKAKACTFTYQRTDGSAVQLNYHHVVQRLFKMSFDAYACPELRWGAEAADELATCPNDPDKMAWYQAEQPLRNQIDRTYDTKMGFTLDQLQAHAPGSGVLKAPDVDLRAYLWSLK